MILTHREMLPLHFACGPHGEAIVPMLLQYSPEWQVVQMVRI